MIVIVCIHGSATPNFSVNVGQFGHVSSWKSSIVDSGEGNVREE